MYGERTIWETGSYGDVGNGLTYRITNKPCVTKGFQTVLFSDFHR